MVYEDFEGRTKIVNVLIRFKNSSKLLYGNTFSWIFKIFLDFFPDQSLKKCLIYFF